MKMSRKAMAVLVLSVSVTMGAFVYNSGITRGLGFGKNSPESTAAKLTVPDDIVKPYIYENIQVAGEAPPAEKKAEVKVGKPAPKPLKKSSTTNTVLRKRNTLASRGGYFYKKTIAVKNVKPAAYTTSSYVVSAAERDMFYRLVSAEAGAESFEGKLAVATVIMNRVTSSDFPNTIRGVIYDTKWGVQFTPIADGRINEPATAESKRAVDKVLEGYRSFGPKIMFFVNPEKSVNMYVINNRTYYTTIGQHKFYY